MNDDTRCQLLERLRAALSAWPVPLLEPQSLRNIEFPYICEALGVLWKDGAAGPIPVDYLKIFSAAVHLSAEQFHFGFLRLLESALMHPETEAGRAAIELASDPVPRDSTEPPVKFRDFPRDEIVLINDCLQAMIGSLDREQLSEIDLRATDRAIRNWNRFAAAAKTDAH